MKILYDHQAFSGSRYGGIARYFHDLMETLSKMGEEVSLSINFSNNEYLKESTVKKPWAYKYIFGFMPTSMLVSRTNRLTSIRAIQKGNFDVFHPTFFHTYHLKHIGNKPFVLTYHDLIKERFNLGHLDNVSRENKQLLLDKASKVIAISENTKQDLMEFYRISADKIDVVPHASTFKSMSPYVNSHLKLPEKYLLYLGTRNDYKNFDNLLQAIVPIFAKHKDFHLVCAGGGKFNEVEVQRLQALGLEKRVQQITFHADNTLFNLYQKATAFVYPSRYEGFGIPILEAFACGCPIILSNTSCFPEVAQDAGWYFNPDSVAEMTARIEEVLLDKALQESLVKKGFLRQNDFSTQQTAQKTLDVYRSVL
ncbi:glycosyltransferase family 4 protein [Flectobacillus major]|uniref:glycosyltransferase family 4 protein n=1 Tax=Flectobacillus major TaxID=103 RepID=UPI0003F92FF0|nr:glycosyltransferase family 1 protein [Flectobacillus major]